MFLSHLMCFLTAEESRLWGVDGANFSQNGMSRLLDWSYAGELPHHCRSVVPMRLCSDAWRDRQAGSVAGSCLHEGTICQFVHVSQHCAPQPCPLVCASLHAAGYRCNEKPIPTEDPVAK